MHRALGAGVVYYGSARLKADSPHFVMSRELGRLVSTLLGSPTWTGGGPGMMEAASLGAMDAGKAVGGIRIEREAGTKVRSAAQSYLKPECQVFCKFLSPRKVALVDAAGPAPTHRPRARHPKSPRCTLIRSAP